MKNELDPKSINGQFDLDFKDNCIDHKYITWKVLKSLALSESEIHPYVSGGLFRIPKRLFHQHFGRDVYDPVDNIKTICTILKEFWSKFSLINENERLLFVLLAYKLKVYDVSIITNVSTKFIELYGSFPVYALHEVVRIKERARFL